MEAEKLRLVDKQIAQHALAGIVAKADATMTSHPWAHRLSQAADTKLLASAMTAKDVLRNDGLIMRAVGKLLPHISIFGAGAFVVAVSREVGAGAFLLQGFLIAAIPVTGSIVYVAMRAAQAAAPVGEAAARSAGQALADLFNEPAAAKQVLASHVDGRERELYQLVGSTVPFRPVTLVGPVGALLIIVGALLIFYGVSVGYEEASQVESQRTPFPTLDTDTRIPGFETVDP